MGRISAKATAALAWGTVLTVAVAWPVVTAPSQRLFGTEIVGRHHDAYTVILQMATSGPVAPYIQPLTDHLGWLLARFLHPVAAYNLLVLLTFPLATIAAYALARYLSVPPAGALFAGLAFAFSPVHLAHAAYHAHLAQVQWLPLYFLALFAFIDQPSIARAGLLALSCASLVLSSFYFGFIGAVISPVAVVAYWWARPPAERSWRQLVPPVGVLAVLAAGAVGALGLFLPGGLAQVDQLAFMPNDLVRYSANWWSYVIPTVDHPVFGRVASEVFQREGVTLGLVEQQLELGIALLALAAAAGVLALRRGGPERSGRGVFALCVIGAAAFAVSLGPAADGCHSGSWIPACRLYDIAPMFRAYARFGIVVQLAAAVAGGLGLSLVARRSTAGLVGACCLAALVAFEYAPLPWRWHDVLPTEGHRWLASHAAAKSLDCTRARPEEASVPWLMGRPLFVLGGEVGTCNDPHLGDVLARLGYSHVIVRRDATAESFPGQPPGGLTLAAEFPDSRVYQVAGEIPPPR